MSIEAISMASRIVIKQSSVKFVLIALADCADASGLCWPSTEHVMRFTSLDRKTVISAIDKLEEMKLVADSGRRAGRTKQVKVYEINLDLLSKEAAFYAAELKRTKNGTLKDEGNKNPPKNGTLPKTEPSQKRNPPVFSGKDSQKRDTEPSGTVNCVSNACEGEESESEEQKYNRKLHALNGFDLEFIGPFLKDVPKAIDPEVLVDFMKHLKVKRGPTSISTWKMLLLTFKEFQKRGVDLNESLRATMIAGLTTPIEPRAQGSPRAGPSTAGRPSMNADFTNANYQGTPNDQLPPELRKPARGITPFDPDAIDS